MRIREYLLRFVAVVAMVIAAAFSGQLLAGNDVDLVRMDGTSSAKSASKQVLAAHDVEGIAIFEIDGNYDRGNAEARAEIARRYIELYGDDHDFLIAFSDFEFSTGEASAFANLIKNDVQGVGMALFDSSSAFGSSSGRLQSYIDMAALSRWAFNPSSARYGTTLDVATHELVHRWVAHPRFLRNGQPSDDLLGRDQAHWNFFLDTDASVMYGSDWRAIDGGRFEAIDVRHRLSPLDLYLAGLYAAAEVPDMTLIRNGIGASPEDIPALGFKTTGTAETISIAQIIGANGARVPDISTSPKHFSAGLLLLVRPGQPLADRAVFDLQRFATDFETRFAAITRGRSSLSIRNLPAQPFAAGQPVMLSGGILCTACSLDIAQAKIWLASKQRPADGSFIDKEINPVVSSASAMRAMTSEGFGSSAQVDSVRAWLANFSTRQFDDLDWKQRADPAALSAADNDLVESRLHASTTTLPGLAPGWSHSAWDASAMLGTAAFRALPANERAAFVDRLQVLQNSDGGFGISPGGASHVGLTAWALNELTATGDIDALALAINCATWLQTQRNVDGSYGVGADAVLPTVWAIAGLVRLGSGVDVTSSIAFLRSRQSASGDWNGSVFTTAELVRVLGQIDKPNLSFDAPITADPVAPISGDVVQLRTRIRNDGVAADHVRLAWFLGDPDQGGIALGAERDLGRVGAGQTIETTIDWNTVSLSGAQALFAVLDGDDLIDELNENDNRQTLAIQITALPMTPDAALLRSSFTLTPTAATAFPTQVDLVGQIANLGGAPIAAMPVVLYTVRNGNRSEVARQVVDIGALSSTPLQLSFSLQRNDPLSLDLVADPDNTFAEIRETNNALRFELASSAGIDLSIVTSDIEQLTRPAVAGQATRFRITARNHGASASPTFQLQPRIVQGAQSYLLSSVSIQLDAGSSAEREVTWPSAILGAASLEISLDPSAATADVDRSNNVALLPFDVVDPSAPNFSIDTQSILMTPTPLDQMQPATLHARVLNAGAAITGDWAVAVSTGGETGPRTELARVLVAGGIGAGATSDLDVPLPPLPTAGDRYFFVIADPDNAIAELDESDNNAFVRAAVRSIPDASVTISSLLLTPSVPVPGESVRADVTVRNLGQQPLNNLRVRLLDGDASSGVVIGADQIATAIAGGGTAQLSWTWTYGAATGARSISIQADPENAIAEIREDNNIAVVALQALGDQYATEPYISPNDDGIKESTQVVFRGLATSPALIDIISIADTVVRTYPPEQFEGENGTAVLWEGRTDLGRIVPDGAYRVRALSAAGDELAQVTVVVDTNRSSILEAVGTGLERYTSFKHGYSESELIAPPLAYADQDVVLLRDPLNPSTADPTDRMLGLYRFDLLLGTLDPVINAGWVLARGSNAHISALHWHESGSDVVLVVSAGNQHSLWRVRVDALNVAEQLAAFNADVWGSSFTLKSAGKARVLLWRSGSSSLARSYRLDTGAESSLDATGAAGSVLRVFDDGFLVGGNGDGMHFVSFNPSIPARSVLTRDGPGYVALYGNTGALIHVAQGATESVEWRSFRSPEVRTLMHALAQPIESRCGLIPEDANWFGGSLLINDTGNRNIAIADVDAGTLRRVNLPLSQRRGEYAVYQRASIGAAAAVTDESAAYAASVSFVVEKEYNPVVQRVGITRSRQCRYDVGLRKSTRSQAKSNFGADSLRKSFIIGIGEAPEPGFSMVYEGELVEASESDGSNRDFYEGAYRTYLLDRSSGAVSILGDYTNWSLTDPLDRQSFPALFERYGLEYGANSSDRPYHLIAEFDRLTSVSLPFLALSDGSGVAFPPAERPDAGYDIFLQNGYFTGASLLDPYSLRLLWPSERHLAGVESPASEGRIWLYSSLANQTTRLRAQGNTSGIDLLGIASDKNFRQYELAWAAPSTPDQWFSIGAPVQESAIDGELMSWTPPNAGQYLIRLKTEDKAGNMRQTVSRALSPAGADIANPRLESRYLSPNGDGLKDALTLSLSVVRPTTLKFEIRSVQGAVLFAQQQQVAETGPFAWTWNGVLASGQVVTDGAYRVAINDWFATGFTVDGTPPSLDLKRVPAHGAVNDGKVAIVHRSTVHSLIEWTSVELNPQTLTLQRSASPGDWISVDDRFPIKGTRVLDKDDDDDYRIVAEDRAGNRSVSVATAPFPPDLRLVSRLVIDSDGVLGPWGCGAPWAECNNGSPEFFAAKPMAVDSGARIVLDLYLAPGTLIDQPSLRYRTEQFGSDVSVGPWQVLSPTLIERTATELRLTLAAPVLPLGSRILVQAGTRLSNAQILYSEAAQFEYLGISPPRIYANHQTCSPGGIEVGLPILPITASWVCIEESLLGLTIAPTLTVIGVDGDVRAVQVPTRVVDGVVLFELADIRCRELIARVTSASGRAYSSRSSCPSGSSNPLSYVLTRVFPAIEESCNAVPQHMMRFQAAFIPPGDASVTRIQASYDLPSGVRRAVLDVVDPPAIDADCAGNPGCLGLRQSAGVFDASDLPDGSYDLVFEATLSAGSPLVATRTFQVDRSPPIMDIRVPREGRHECVLHEQLLDSQRMMFPQDARISDPSGVDAYVHIAPIPPNTLPYAWPSPWVRDWTLYPGVISGTLALPIPLALFAESIVAEYPNAIDLGQGQFIGFGPMIGPVQARYTALNWSGSPTCKVVSFFSDVGVDVNLTAKPGTPRINGYLSVINPSGMPELQVLRAQMQFDESVRARIDVVRGRDDEVLLVTTLAADAEYAEGVHDFSWDGTAANGSFVADGQYAIRVHAVDDCGYEADGFLPVAVDTTAPEIEIESPSIGESFNGLLIPAVGVIEDLSGGTFVTTIESAVSTPIAHGNMDPVVPRTFRASWNRGDISGPVILRVTAIDLVGNERIFDRPFLLAPRPAHLFDDARALPELASPNGDGQFDRVEIRYALAANVDVGVRVLRANDSVVAVLQNAEPELSGNHSLQWSGQGLSAEDIDGVYRIELHAVDALAPSVTETVHVPIAIDRTAPQLTLLSPVGDFTQGQGSLAISVEDQNFGTGAWRFGSREGALVAPGTFDLLYMAELEDGSYQLHVLSSDVIANASEISRTVVIDRTPPTAEILLPTEQAVLGGEAAQAVIEGTASDVNLDHSILSLVLVSAPNNRSILLESVVPVVASPLHTLSLARPDGEYLLQLEVHDKAEHRSEATRRIHIDHTAPVALLTSPIDNAYVSRTFAVTGTASDLHLADYRVRIATPDQASVGLWSDLLIEHESVSDADLGVVDLPVPDGDYFLELIARDLVALQSTQRIRLHLDSTPPPAPIQLVAHQQGDHDVALAWQADATSDLAGYQVYRDGARLNLTLSPGRSFLDVDLRDGSFLYEVSAIDLAGNESARSNGVLVTIDRQPPVVDLLQPADAAIVSGMVDIVGTAFSVDDFDHYRLSVLDGSTQAPLQVLAEARLSVRNSTIASWDTRAYPEGTSLRVLLEAWDASGNLDTDSIVVTVDNIAPAAPTGLVAVDLSGDGQISWNANVEPDLLGYVLLRDGRAVNGGTAFPDDLRILALADIHYLDLALVDGVHAWIVFAIDRAGNLSPASAPAELTIARRPPDIRIIDPLPERRFEDALRIEAISDDLDIAEVRFDYRAVGSTDWTTLGAALAVRPFVISWTPGALPHGAYEIRGQARDSGGLEDATPPIVPVHYADLTPPAQVVGLEAHAEAADVYLTWQAVSADDLAFYRVERSSYSGGGFELMANLPAGTTSAIDIDPGNGTHYYRVCALDDSGNISNGSGFDAAFVFTPAVDTPYSPIRLLLAPISGSSPVAGSLRVEREVAATSQTVATLEIDSGAFTVPAIALLEGENHLLMQVTDSEGNISRIADAWITTGNSPSAPTGLAVEVNNHDVAAHWNSNPEADIAGYRLFRRDFPVLVERDLDDLSATGQPDDAPQAAIDGDAQTAWLTDFWFGNGELSEVWLELASSVPHLITAVDVQWLQSRKPLSFDVLAFSGRAWVKLASVSEVGDPHSLRLQTPYLTDRLRIVPTSTVYGQSIALAEVKISERPLIESVDYADHVIDGSYPYTVSVVNDLGFESDLSAPAVAEVGDIQPPEAVVLSGTVVQRDAQLSWTASASADVARYELQRNGVHLVYAEAPQTTYADVGLINGSYAYQVIALDAFDNASVPSNVVALHVDVQGPGIPHDLNVSRLQRGGVLDVRWAPGVGAAATHYSLRRSEVEAGPFVAIADVSVLQWLDEPLVNGQRYWYTIEAFDLTGNASGQSAPVSGVPEDQQAPLPPVLTFPVHDGEAIELQSVSTIAAGVVEAGASVDVRRDGAGVVQVGTASTDRARTLDGSYVDGRLRLSPSGSMFFSENNQQAYDTENGNHIGVLTSGEMLGWTRDDHIVHRDNNGIWHSTSLSGTDTRTLALSLTEVETARFSSDLRYVLARGTQLNNGNPLRAIWLIDRTQTSPRRVVGIDADSVDFSTVVFSEFAGFAAWRSQSGDLLHLRLSTAQARPLASVIDATRISLSPRNGEALHVRTNGGISIVNRVDADRVSRVAGPGIAAAWSPDGDQYLVAEVGGMLALHREVDDTLVRRIDLDVDELTDIDWSMAGRVVVTTSSDARSIDLAGYFRSTPISLHAGDNRIDLYATDASGQGQASAAAGVVHVTGAQPLRADLSIQAEDIRFLPAAGAPGQVYAAQFTVRNVGNGASAAATTRLSLICPDGSQVSIPGTPSVPVLSAGANAALGITLGQLDQSGSYWLRVELLTGAGDGNAGNDAATQRLSLSIGAAPVLELQANAASFAPGIDAAGFVRVRNVGSPWTGRVRMRVLASNGEILSTLPTLDVSGLAFGAEKTQSWLWPTTDVFAGGYRVQADMYDIQDQLVATRTIDFSIAVVRDLRLEVTSDRSEYALADSVRVNATLDYRSGNAVLASARLRIQLTDPAGMSEFVSTRALSTLLPGYRIQIPGNWIAVGTTGLHSIRAELLEGDAVTLLAQGGFQLSSNGSVISVSGAIEPSPAPLIAGRDGRINYALRNNAAGALAVDGLRLRLLRADTMAVVAEQSIAGAVAPGAQLQGSLTIGQTALDLGAYLAVLDWRATPSSTPVMLATRSVSVVDGVAPTILIVTPEANGWARGNAPISAQVIDLHSGVDQVEVEIDAGSWRLAPAQGQALYAGTASGLSDGPHQARFRARDRVGNETLGDPRTFQVDNSPPRIIVDGVEDGDVVANAVTPTITVEETNPDSVTIALDSAAFASGSTVDADGSYLLSVVARDLSGNSAAKSLRFTIDRAAPMIVFTVPQDGDQITLASIEARLQTEPLIQVQLSVGAYIASTQSDATGIAAFAGVPLVFGSNVLSARATDFAGNQSSAVTIQVARNDNSGADLVGSLVPAAPTFASGVPARLDWQIVNPRPAVANAQLSRIRAVHVGSAHLLGEDNVVVDVPANGQVNGTAQFATTDAPLGRYVATLTVQVGNDSVQLASAEFEMQDTEAPQLTLIAPAPGTLTNQPLRMIATAADRLGTVTSVRYRLDGGLPVAMTALVGSSDTFESSLLDLPDADYTVAADALDNAGNLASTSARSFVIDRTPPVIEIKGVADGGEYTASVVPVIVVSDLHPDTQSILLDGQPFVSGNEISTEGMHEILVSARDGAGNSAQRRIAFLIDRTAPVIAFSFPDEGAVVAVPQIDVGGLSEALVRIEFRIAGVESTVFADDLGGFIVPMVSLQIEDNLLQARAIDALGNSSDWISRHVLYRPNAGAVLFAELTLSAVDLPLGDALIANYTLRNDGTVPVIGLAMRVRWVRVADQQQLSEHPFALSLMPAATDSGNVSLQSATTLPGAHVVVLEGLLTQLDGAQSWQTLATAQVTVRDVLAPLVEVVAPASGSYVDSGFQLRVRADDEHSAIASVQGLVATSPVAMQSIGNGEYTSTINIGVEGPLELSARAADSAGNQAEAASLVVIVDLFAPEIAISGVDQGALINHSVMPIIAIADISPTESIITIDGQAFISGAVVQTEGAHLLRVNATDALGRAGKMLRSFTIDLTPPAVTITSPADGAILFAEATRVIGNTEPLARLVIEAGAFSAVVDADSSGVFSLDNVPLAPGFNTISARATDRAGNVGNSTSILIERRGQPVTALQGSVVLAASEWPNGSSLASGFNLHNIGTADLIALPVTLEVRRRDSQQLLQSNLFTIDLAAGAVGSQAVDWSTSLWGVGVVDITLSALLPQSVKATTLDTRSLILLDRELPNIAFELPLANAQMRSGDAIRVHASDRLSAIALTEWRIDYGIWIVMPAIDALAGQYGSTLPSLAFGAHQLEARTRDAAGNSATTQPVPIVVVGVLPISVTAPVDGSSTDAASVAFTGSTAANALVRVSRINGQWQAQADAVGNFSVSGVTLIEGSNVFSVRAEDAFGNTSDVVNIRVEAIGVVDAISVPAIGWRAWLALWISMFVIAAARMRNLGRNV